MLTRAAVSSNDDGLSLVEIIVAMFMLSVLSIALIPVLITGLKQSVANSTDSTATQVAHQELELATAKSKCLDMLTYSTGTGFSMTDSHGILLQAYRTVTNTGTPSASPICGSADTYPETVTVKIVVKRVSTGATLSAGTSLVYLASYN